LTSSYPTHQAFSTTNSCAYLRPGPSYPHTPTLGELTMGNSNPSPSYFFACFLQYVFPSPQAPPNIRVAGASHTLHLNSGARLRASNFTTSLGFTSPSLSETILKFRLVEEPKSYV